MSGSVETQYTEQPAAQSESATTQPLSVSGLLWFSAASIIAIALMNVIARAIEGAGGGKKNVLGKARWATKSDINAARKKSHKQLASDKHDEISLWINSPRKIEGTKVSEDKDTVWLPDMARGTSVIGGSGSGKSYSVIKPTLRAAIAQGMPVVLLDTDYPGLAKTIAPLAKDAGYEVSIYAPGYPESRVCNPLDFISDCRDSTGASQIAKTLHNNFSEGGSGKEDKFFQVSGELATEASLLLAKALKHTDMLTAFAILKDEDMIQRVRQVGTIDPWLELAFGQLLSTAKSEKTVDSIRGTAAILFGQLMRPDILPTLVGETTMPLKVTGKRLLIFGVKQNIRLVVSPLIAAIIHAIITQNVLPGRTEPLFLSLDELPSMYFPEISEWLSEKRKYGLCCQIGYQSLEQLKKRYGPEQADVIFTNTATKFLFNPQSIQSARVFSETLGETDTVYKTKSRSYGKSRSRSRTEHRTKTRLFSPEQFMSFDSGSCVLLSPGIGAKRQKFIPRLLDPLTVADREIALQKSIEDRWNGFIAQAIKEGVGDKHISPDEITKRVKELKDRLPIKSEKDKKSHLEDLLKL